MGGEAALSQMTQPAAEVWRLPGDKEPRKDPWEYLHLEMGGRRKTNLKGQSTGEKN